MLRFTVNCVPMNDNSEDFCWLFLWFILWCSQYLRIYIEFNNVVTAEWKGYGREHLWHNRGRTDEKHEETNCVFGVPDDILTRWLNKMSLECYQYTILSNPSLYALYAVEAKGLIVWGPWINKIISKHVWICKDLELVWRELTYSAFCK